MMQNKLLKQQEDLRLKNDAEVHNRVCMCVVPVVMVSAAR